MNRKNTDIIVIGGGAAGLTAAQYAARANLPVTVIEGPVAGGQALQIDTLENYPGLVPAVSGFEFSGAMRKQAESFGAEFVQDSVSSIKKNGDIFTVTTATAEYLAPAVILATGAGHRKLGIPGESEFTGSGVSWCATCDGPFFKNKRILVVGGGDAACDEALFLSKFSDKVTIIHRKNRFRAQKAISRRIIKNPDITVLFNSVVKEIKGEIRANGTKAVTGVILEDTITGEIAPLDADAVFIFIGMDPRTDLVPDVQKDSNGYIVTDDQMETSIKGLFCAGDVRAKQFRQIVTAAADGATAAHCAARYIEDLKGNSYT